MLHLLVEADQICNAQARGQERTGQHTLQQETPCRAANDDVLIGTKTSQYAGRLDWQLLQLPQLQKLAKTESPTLSGPV